VDVIYTALYGKNFNSRRFGDFVNLLFEEINNFVVSKNFPAILYYEDEVIVKRVTE